MNADDDQIVTDYLRRLSAAARVLPADRRAELIEEITSHIAEARAGAGTAGGGPAGVRNILDRLGDPADIVRAAADSPPGSLTGYPGLVGDPGLVRAASPDRRGRAGALEITAVILLLIGGIVVPVIGWVAGVVLLWASPRWRTGDKLLGTLVWPGGLLAPLVLLTVGVGGALIATQAGCSGQGGEITGVTSSGKEHVQHLPPAATCTAASGPPTWLVIVIGSILLAAAIAGPVFTAGRLLRRARQEPAAGPTADPAAFQPG